MMIPTVHLNGTGKQNLLKELEVAYAAVSTTIDVLRQVTVHGRDFYPQGDHAYPQARIEMDARLSALSAIQDDLLTMHLAIDEQGWD